MITWENYEEYMMMHADGELSAADEQALMAFVAAHPELKSELSAYDLTVLKPDTNVVFEYKSSLLRTAPAKPAIAFTQWRKYSIAAGIAAILVSSVVTYRYQNNTPGSSFSATKKTAPILIDTATAVQPKEALAATQQLTPTTPITTTPVPQATVQHANAQHTPAQPKTGVGLAVAHNMKAHKNIIAARNNSKTLNEMTSTRERIESPTLPVAALKTAPVHVHEEELPGDIAVPEVTTVAATTEQKKSLWDMLPINKENKQELKAVAAAVADKYEQINTIKQTLQEKTLTIRVEKRKLIISF